MVPQQPLNVKRSIILICSIFLIILGYILTQTTSFRGKAYLANDETITDIHTFEQDDTHNILTIDDNHKYQYSITSTETPYIYLVTYDPYGKPIYYLGCTLLCLSLIIRLRSIKWKIILPALLLSLLYFSLRYILREVPLILQSPWLYFHVTSIMTAYALFIIIAIRPDRKVHLWGITLLSIGIFLGSIWADQAWGSYWSWDPKETWALITLITYSIPFILNTLNAITPSTINHKPSTIYTIYLRLALLSVLMTYFGVNYLLGGLHSYA